MLHENVFIDAALQHMEILTMMDDLDNEHTVEELSKAITAMTPGSDGIKGMSKLF